MGSEGSSSKSRLKLTLWIAGVLIVLVMGGYFFLTKMRELAAASEAPNRLGFAAFSLALLDEHRAHALVAPGAVKIHPELSWRIAILPQMEEQELYDAFHLDEPWDSPHNKQLIPRMPADLAPVGYTLEPGLTCMVMPVEAQATNDLFAQLPPNSPEAFSKLLERVGSVGRVVEVPPELAVIWTKPDDLSITDPRIQAFRPGVLLIGNVNGHVRGVAPNRVTPEKLKAMFTPPPEENPDDN